MAKKKMAKKKSKKTKVKLTNPFAGKGGATKAKKAGRRIVKAAGGSSAGGAEG